MSNDLPAYFLPFPLRMESLMQAADLNLEYFSIRFILACLIKGTLSRLMACVVGQRVVGLAYLEFRRQLLKDMLEIKFHATLRGTEEAKGQKDRAERDLKLAIVKRCLEADSHPAIAEAALAALVKYQRKIPESKGLMALGSRDASPSEGEWVDGSPENLSALCNQ